MADSGRTMKAGTTCRSYEFMTMMKLGLDLRSCLKFVLFQLLRRTVHHRRPFPVACTQSCEHFQTFSALTKLNITVTKHIKTTQKRSYKIIQ